MRDPKTPWQKQYDAIQAREQSYLHKNHTRKEHFFTAKIDEKMPVKMQSTLDAAFAKAFQLVFEKGTTIIEKTYKKEDLQHAYKVNEFSANLRENRKTLRTFQNKATLSGAKNLLISGAEGIGLGILGIGLPDIPLFVGMLLKGIYEIALHYGYDYNTPEEKYFILKTIQASCSYGPDLVQANKELDDYIQTNTLPSTYDQTTQIKNTSSVLSIEMMYTKFIQGIPVVGAVGGAFDSIYMKRILSFANLKYNKRLLIDRRR